jgi:hypothetical protein
MPASMASDLQLEMSVFPGLLCNLVVADLEES